MREQKLLSFGLLLLTLSIGIVIGTLVNTGAHAARGQVAAPDATPLHLPDAVLIGNEFTRLAKKLEPSVVNITADYTPKEVSSKKDPNGEGDSGGDDALEPFKRFFHGGPFAGESPRALKHEQSGSGFIVDRNGYIITNNHVVEKMDHIRVKLHSEGGEYRARLIGYDRETDLAVIKIDPKTPLDPVTIGNSDAIQVGDWAVAIGSPFGLEASVTAGIVSATGREIIPTQQFQRFIQTDAAINPGNSGGPLVDMAGEVIGMNTAIFTQSSGSEGVGFAMPSNTIASVYNMLIGPDHKVTRGSIGITFQSAESSAVSRVYGFANGGVLVNTITPDGPAAKGGVKPGDVIVSVDGKPIKDGDDLVADISTRRVGSTVQLGILRNGSKQTLTVGIADRAKLFANVGSNSDSNAAPAEADAGESKLGIQVDAVPAQTASKLGIQGGVSVTSVRPGSFADEIGIPTGTVILEINKKPISDKSDFNAIVNGLKSGQDVAFKVRLQGPNAPAGDSYLGGTLP